MPELAIRRIVLYKHGVGYFERRGSLHGTALQLSFPREAMDDILKSMVAIDLGGGQVQGIDYETPEDRHARLAKGSIHLSDTLSLLDLLRDLRGRMVQIEAQGEQIAGMVVGVDYDPARPLANALVSIVLDGGQQIRTVAVRSITNLRISDPQASDDLRYFLRASQSEEDRRSATLRLSPGDHDLLVGYVAPAPAWRVSYRLLFEPAAEATSAATTSVQTILLQGWGLFDNQLDEDLQDVSLTFVAGMPVSFRYRLYEPHTPDRPYVEDEERTLAGPIEFEAFAESVPPPAPMMAKMASPMAAGLARNAPMALAAAPAADFSLTDLAQSTTAAASGAEAGALFQYHVAHPVSVARGQSAMVPIVSQQLSGRKELLYNRDKLPKHPVASLRLPNETGLTLERGPVTVLETSDYAGEAVLPFTRPEAELIIPYAVELGIAITESISSTRQIKGLRVRQGYVLVEEWDIQRVEYLIHNTLAKASEVTLEMVEPSGYELLETRAADERAQGLARWRIACAAKQETKYIIQHRRLISRHEQVRAFTLTHLRTYFENRFLDAASFKALGAILELYEQINQKQLRQRQIEQERNQIYKRQQQTQGSLGPLGREGEEGKLRSRYVQQLNELENQLNALLKEEQQIQQQIEQLEQRAKKSLDALVTE
jgi:hypothetical protein